MDYFFILTIILDIISLNIKLNVMINIGYTTKKYLDSIYRIKNNSVMDKINIGIESSNFLSILNLENKRKYIGLIKHKAFRININDLAINWNLLSFLLVGFITAKWWMKLLKMISFKVVNGVMM